jgi:hypothetical protein
MKGLHAGSRALALRYDPAWAQTKTVKIGLNHLRRRAVYGQRWKDELALEVNAKGRRA